MLKKQKVRKKGGRRTDEAADFVSADGLLSVKSYIHRTQRESRRERPVRRLQKLDRFKTIARAAHKPLTHIKELKEISPRPSPWHPANAPPTHDDDEDIWLQNTHIWNYREFPQRTAFYFKPWSNSCFFVSLLNMRLSVKSLHLCSSGRRSRISLSTSLWVEKSIRKVLILKVNVDCVNEVIILTKTSICSQT